MNVAFGRVQTTGQREPRRVSSGRRERFAQLFEMMAPRSSPFTPSAAAPRGSVFERILVVALVVVVLVGGYAIYDVTHGPSVRHAAVPSISTPTGLNVVPGAHATVPLGSYGRVGSAWRVKVVGVLWHVSAKAVGVKRSPKRWNVVVQFTARYIGRGRGSTQSVVKGLQTIGNSSVPYPVRRHVLGHPQSGVQVASRTVGTDAVLFTVAASDAPSLRLLARPPGQSAVRFALR